MVVWADIGGIMKWVIGVIVGWIMMCFVGYIYEVVDKRNIK